MTTTLKTYCCILLIVFGVSSATAQMETSKWKALFAVGLNSPAKGGFVSSFEGNNTNFPTINLGVQRMFTQQLGAKIDFGYNRIKSTDASPEFKINYNRINLQFVYDATTDLTFLPIGMGLVGHVGPGYSMVKPLSDYKENKVSYLNVMAGIEFHYALAKTVSMYVDGSYIIGFADSFNPISQGFGSFNGNMFTATIGLSVSLSGCTYCN